MTTTLKPIAYLLPAFLIVVPIAFIGMMQSMPNNTNYTPYFLLVLVTCLGAIVFTLFSDYKQYSFDSQNLTLKDLITKKQTIIPLSSIVSLSLQERKVKNGSYHNIIVETEKKESYTLRGVYVYEMVEFFRELDKAVKKG